MCLENVIVSNGMSAVDVCGGSVCLVWCVSTQTVRVMCIDIYRYVYVHSECSVVCKCVCAM